VGQCKWFPYRSLSLALVVEAKFLKRLHILDARCIEKRRLPWLIAAAGFGLLDHVNFALSKLLAFQILVD
jgi:hypothetical protein